MERIESNRQTRVLNSNTRSSLPIHGELSRARPLKSHRHTKNNNYKFSYRYNKYLHSIKKLCLILAASVIATPAHAADVGGVSATANPIANSSGSVTNQAIQVLQGPYITNTYGGGIQCQGATMNITPYVTGTGNFQRPFERYYMDPVYDVHDADDDGQIDNPGNILYEMPTRTGQTDNYNLSLGLSATWSRPLDTTLQEQCKEAVAVQIDMQRQVTANKRLDFEIARLKNCGELMKAGIMFHPKSPYAGVCADVVLVNPPGVVANHTHGLQPNQKVEPVVNGEAEDLGTFEIKSNLITSKEEVPSSSDTHSQPVQNDKSSKDSSPRWFWPWSKPALSQDETPSTTDQQEVSQEEQTHQQP